MSEPVPPPRPRPRTLLLAMAVLPVGIAGVAIAAATHRLDSALLFVGVPCLVAFCVGLLRPEDGWSSVFQVVTIGLLLTSALLQEAAVCVLLAAPLIYAVAALAYWAASRGRSHQRSLALAPMLLIVTVEGILPGTRVMPQQRAVVHRVVAADCATFTSALARGPALRPDDDRGRLLHLFPYPTPTAASGQGLARGDEWKLTVSGGQLTTRVTERAGSQITFAVTGDTTRLRRWVTLSGGVLSWRQTPSGCEARMSVEYVRALDPALWFGPVTAVFMDAGAQAFLAGLD